MFERPVTALEDFNSDFDPNILTRGLTKRFSEITGRSGPDSNGDKKIINRTIDLMRDYQIRNALLAFPLHTAVVFGVAESLLDTYDPLEEEALLNVLKLASVLESHGEVYRTLCGNVEKLSALGLPEGRWFDPDADHNDLFANKADYDGFLEAQKSDLLSQRGEGMLKKWGVGSVLHSTRTKLKVDQRYERLYKLNVLDCSEDEMGKATGAWGWCTPNGATSVIAVSKDQILGRKRSILQHEYVHSQSDGLYFGLWGYLLNGISEAATELFVDEPLVYEKQREVLQILHHKSPALDIALPYAYQGSEQFQHTVASEIIKAYGFKGFVTVARMDDGKQPRFKNPIQKSIYLSTERVKDFLNEADRKLYIV